jgi:hypothetical protein
MYMYDIDGGHRLVEHVAFPRRKGFAASPSAHATARSSSAGAATAE